MPTSYHAVPRALPAALRLQSLSLDGTMRGQNLQRQTSTKVSVWRARQRTFSSSNTVSESVDPGNMYTRLHGYIH